MIGKAAATVLALAAAVAVRANQQTPRLPSGPLVFAAFTASFDPDGSFALEGPDWPAFKGRWSPDSDGIAIATQPMTDCVGSGRYRVRVDGTHVTLDVVSDSCTPRRMILDRSTWRPKGEAIVIPERRIVRTRASPMPALPAAASAAGSWPSFRGTGAAGLADRENLPERWDVKSGQNILWRTPIPGLAHSSPIVWGDRIFVTSAISSRPDASFRPGLYGDGDASDDRSPHRWMIYALDTRTGKVVWERVAAEGEPLNARHVKSTYASATPATDGRTVVAWFGSQGVYAYDVNGAFRWKVDLGRVDIGAYDIPTYEWGPASSPIIWNGLVILQCDTQADSFVMALNVTTGEIVWKTPRQELPSWGSPTVAMTADGPQLVTNASNLIRGYDPRTGRELWHLDGSSKLTAPTPIFADGLFVVSSGRAPERPIFVVRPNGSVVWSKTARGPYMPTPLAYRGVLYVLGNNGVFDAYDLKTGEEIYRARMPEIGSGFSASPVASDGKIYVSSEDGDVSVIRAGKTFEHAGTNSMGELIMATPAISNGVLYVRSVKSLTAVSSRR